MSVKTIYLVKYRVHWYENQMNGARNNPFQEQIFNTEKEARKLYNRINRYLMRDDKYRGIYYDSRKDYITRELTDNISFSIETAPELVERKIEDKLLV